MMNCGLASKTYFHCVIVMKTNDLYYEVRCRAEANNVLQSFYVGAPEEIDIAVMAKLCKLKIEYGGLDSCEGRLITNANGGTIRVGLNQSEERRRFTIAHEIGHYRLHKEVLIIDNKQDLNSWYGRSVETEANVFAAELLMPEFLFAAELKGKYPSMKLVNDLSRKYRTSKLATAIQMLEFTREPCSLVYSSNGQTKWCKWSKSFAELGFYIPMHKNLHEYSLAHELCGAQSNSTQVHVRAPACAWLDGYDENDRAEVWEDSVKYGDDIISIIFVEDDIQKYRRRL